MCSLREKNRGSAVTVMGVMGDDLTVEVGEEKGFFLAYRLAADRGVMFQSLLREQQTVKESGKFYLFMFHSSKVLESYLHSQL